MDTPLYIQDVYSFCTFRLEQNAQLGVASKFNISLMTHRLYDVRQWRH